MTEFAFDRRESPPAGRDAQSYHRAERLLSVCAYLVDVTLLIAMLIAEWSVSIRSFAEKLGHQPAAALLIYLLLIGLILKAASLPFDYASGFWLEHRYGLSNLSAAGWVKDEIKALMVGGALGALVLEFLYWTLRTWPQGWWLVTGAVLAAFSVVMANVAPVLLLPIFYKLEPLADVNLEERLRRLAETAGAHVRGVYEWKLGEKTKKANAALVGLGNTRRILLADTLLEGFSADEIESVLAHELGHHVHADIWRGLAVQTAATFAGLYVISVALTRWSATFGFRGPSDFANLPLLALVALAVSLILLPVVNGFSRRLERAADAFAVQSVPDPSVFESALERLAALNLAERQPSRWIEFVFHSHPSIERRLEFIRKLSRTSGAVR